MCIRDRLHCGPIVRERTARFRRHLPPAIRPGLHCGELERLSFDRWGSNFPRPSGRGSIAATGRRRSAATRCVLPPAIRPGLHCGHPHTPRRKHDHDTSPGHQAGAPLRRLAGVVHGCARHRSSPGHQAGAPLRHIGERHILNHGCGLPPAIRPGLHCGRWTAPWRCSSCTVGWRWSLSSARW